MDLFLEVPNVSEMKSLLSSKEVSSVKQGRQNRETLPFPEQQLGFY